jgi:MFS family permease
VFLPNWFESKRGLAIGLVAAGGGAVAFVLIPQVQLLIDAGGWRTGCLVMATVLVVVVAPLNMLLQRRRPQDLGALPDGGTVANPGATTRREVLIVDAQWAATEWTLSRAMRTLRFWCFSMGFFLAMFVWYGVLVHQTKYLIDLGFDSTLAAWALGLVPTFGVGGQITLGYLADRIGREWVWTFACTGFLASYVCLLMLPQYPNAALVWAMVVTQGFLGYGVTPAVGAIPADLFQGKQYGRIFGITAVFGSSGGAVGPWVVGEIFDRTGSYDLGWIVAIAACVLSILLIWVAAPRKVRRVAFVQPSSLEPASP